MIGLWLCHFLCSIWELRALEQFIDGALREASCGVMAVFLADVLCGAGQPVPCPVVGELLPSSLRIDGFRQLVQAVIALFQKQHTLPFK